MTKSKVKKELCEFCKTDWIKGFEGRVKTLILKNIENQTLIEHQICVECIANMPAIDIEIQEHFGDGLNSENFSIDELKENKIYKINLKCFYCDTVKPFLMVVRNKQVYLTETNLNCDYENDDISLIRIYDSKGVFIACNGCIGRKLYSCEDCKVYVSEEDLKVIDCSAYCPDCYRSNHAIKDLIGSQKPFRKPLTFEIVRKAISMQTFYHYSDEALEKVLAEEKWSLGQAMRTYDSMSGNALGLYLNDDMEGEVKEMLDKGFEYLPIIRAEHQFCVNVQIIYRKRR